MSPTSFAMLSGAGLVHGKKTDKNKTPIYVHATYDMVAETSGDKIIAKLTDEDRNGATIIVTKKLLSILLLSIVLVLKLIIFLLLLTSRFCY